MNKSYYVYMLASQMHGTLYVGVTNDLERRTIEHKSSISEKSFTAKYKIFMLVYYEEYTDPTEAITREKQIKSGSRKKKIELIESINPSWDDLFEV